MTSRMKKICSYVQLRCQIKKKKRKYVASDSSRPDIYKPFEHLWTKYVSHPQANLSRPGATAADSETPCVCACSSNPSKLCRNAAPRAQLFILPSNFLLSSGIVIARWQAGARTCQCQWTQSWALHTDQRVVLKVSSAPKSLNKLCGVCLGPLKTPKLRTAVSRFQPSSHRYTAFEDLSYISIYNVLYNTYYKTFIWPEFMTV